MLSNTMYYSTLIIYNLLLITPSFLTASHDHPSRDKNVTSEQSHLLRLPSPKDIDLGTTPIASPRYLSKPKVFPSSLELDQRHIQNEDQSPPISEDGDYPYFCFSPKNKDYFKQKYLSPSQQQLTCTTVKHSRHKRTVAIKQLTHDSPSTKLFKNFEDTVEQYFQILTIENPPHNAGVIENNILYLAKLIILHQPNILPYKKTLQKIAQNQQVPLEIYISIYKLLQQRVDMPSLSQVTHLYPSSRLIPGATTKPHTSNPNPTSSSTLPYRHQDALNRAQKQCISTPSKNNEPFSSKSGSSNSEKNPNFCTRFCEAIKQCCCCCLSDED